VGQLGSFTAPRKIRPRKESVTERLAQGKFARFQQLQEGKRDMGINPANVLYVEAVGYDSPSAAESN
jgi:hypothetical protein